MIKIESTLYNQIFDPVHICFLATPLSGRRLRGTVWIERVTRIHYVRKFLIKQNNPISLKLKIRLVLLEELGSKKLEKHIKANISDKPKQYFGSKI